MDGVLTAIAQSAPQLGISGVLITVILILLRREATAEGRHSAEVDRITKTHDGEMAVLRTDIATLRAQVEELHLALDLERDQRRTAEDRAAEVLRRKRGGSSQ